MPGLEARDRRRRLACGHNSSVSASGSVRARFDRPVLVSNLVSGAVWCTLIAVASWPVALLVLAYVLAVALFLAAVYARPALSRRQEALAWVAPWLVGVGLFLALLAGVDDGDGPATLAGFVSAAVVASVLFVGWQLVSLAVRQLMAWRRSVRGGL